MQYRFPGQIVKFNFPSRKLRHWGFESSHKAISTSRTFHRLLENFSIIGQLKSLSRCSIDAIFTLNLLIARWKSLCCINKSESSSIYGNAPITEGHTIRYANLRVNLSIFVLIAGPRVCLKFLSIKRLALGCLFDYSSYNQKFLLRLQKSTRLEFYMPRSGSIERQSKRASALFNASLRSLSALLMRSVDSFFHTERSFLLASLDEKIKSN